MNNRDFKGVWIPKELWLDEKLSIGEKCLLVEIDSLDSDSEKGCFASNEYLGKFIGVSAGRAANMISDLRKRGYIEQVFFDGRNRGIRVKNLHKNVKPAFTETGKQTPQKREQSNTYSNNSSPVEPEAADDLVGEIIFFLNETCGAKYKATSRKTKAAISARLREGFTVYDFQQVIEDRHRRWAKDAKMREYLRPETLFGTKFEGYLEAARNAPTANTDGQLNDAQLSGEEQQSYNDYITYIIETYNDLYRSDCKVLSKRDWHDYRNNATLPGLPFQMTPNEKKKLMTKVHERLNTDTYFRGKFSSVFDCFIQSARAIINQQKPIV